MRQIPKVPDSDDRARLGFDGAVKERLEVLSGLRGGKIELLAADATLDDCIAKINELLRVWQP